MTRPELEELYVPGSADAWERAGFTVIDGVIPVAGVRIRPGMEPWWMTGTPDAPEVEHPNGVIGIDHIVVLTDDFDFSVERFREAGFDYRRTRDAGEGRRQAFFVFGPCLLELTGPFRLGGERLWGVTLVAPDLSGFGGRVKDAVQPGRQITVIPEEAGLEIPVAVMTPR